MEHEAGLSQKQNLKKKNAKTEQGSHGSSYIYWKDVGLGMKMGHDDYTETDL